MKKIISEIRNNSIIIIRLLDPIVMLPFLLLFTIGLFAIASATGYANGIVTDVRMQVITFGVGVIILIASLFFNYELCKKHILFFYLMLIIPLLYMIIFRSGASTINGATRWLKIGPLKIQFSEFAKLLFILTFGAHIDRIQQNGRESINNPRNLLLLILHGAIPIILIMKQPDNGTAMVFCTIMIGMLFVAGLRLRYFVGALISVVLMIPVFINQIFPHLAKYEQNRILVFLNPGLDPQGAGYNVTMAIRAIGSGELWGEGLFKGAIIQHGSLPVAYADFIFAVIGEELGFVGCLTVIILYAVLILRLFSLSRHAKDSYGALIISGIAIMFMHHVIQNIGMNIGLMPVAGIPLPFISYGGSALLASMIGLGLSMNAGRQNNVHKDSIFIKNVSETCHNKG